jgi:hypothetical protein
MSILDLGTGPSRPSVGKKSTRIFLGFGLLVAVIGIGSTFASTISINANQDIEFGQGVQKSIFCGGEKSITVTPISTYANESDEATFGLTGIRVSDIPEECTGKNFVIKAYGANGNASPIVLAHSDNNSSLMPLANVWWANGCPESDAECDLSDYVLDDGIAILSMSQIDYAPAGELASVTFTSDSFTVLIARHPTSSDSVKKISIETQDDAFGLEQCEASNECVAEIS